MNLYWHQYKYFPYEKELALLEIKNLLRPTGIHVNSSAVQIDAPSHPELVNRLVYIASASHEQMGKQDTQQKLLEQVSGESLKRQTTRYSSHGLHEYKGKFNPQMAKAMLNVFHVSPNQLVLDPFCGSGTSLVESEQLGIRALGMDINPMAVYLANAKLASLSVPATQILTGAQNALRRAKLSKAPLLADDERGEYLRAWFSSEYLSQIERLRLAIEKEVCQTSSSVLLAIASNLLRDYSLQEPEDLRIRRRKSPYPNTPLFDAFSSAVQTFCQKLDDAQQILGVRSKILSSATHMDCRYINNAAVQANTFDAALTSPPYATALPYIDTQRLSLVWLGLIPPKEILELDSALVGSREVRGLQKRELLSVMEKNEKRLPETEAALCLTLQNALNERDGFRRQATPRLIYRYFSDMADVFSAVHRVMKKNAPFGLVVGGNHTVLGGKRFDIDTPQHLASIATTNGWEHVDTIQLNTYKRYGLHKKNSTKTEALIILRAT